MTTDKSAVALESTIQTAPREPKADLQTLPDKPLVSVRSDGDQAELHLNELWFYRELLYFLMTRDLKLRYKQTFLGVAWVIMQPLLTTLIFTVFLGALVKVPSDGFPYALFAYAGLLPWAFFSGATLNVSNSLVSNSQLITKVYFPRIIIPLAATGARLVDFAISFVVLAVMMLIYRVPLTWNILMLPVIIMLLLLLALGLGLWTSALNVKYRDISAVLPVFIQLFMYISPVLYSPGLIPARWQWLYMLNPLTGILKGFRASLLGQSFDWMALAIAAAMTLGLFVYAVRAFRRIERVFADIV